MTVRVRFSPAPTGYLHIGSARSALFNWLYARHTDGTMVLRIEDTDTDRSNDELVSAIEDSLGWLGVDWDEQYRQSERFDLYRDVAADFVQRSLAYYCDCTREDVVGRVGENAGYDSHCREREVKPGDGVALRFKTPADGKVEWDDLVRGHVQFDNSVLEDFVIVRSSGVPMFHLANAFDDHDMNITHVVRGEDLVNTTPRVLLLREALGGGAPPTYAHLPLIVNEQRKKLSKRRDDVALGDYAEKGYLASAMRNYLVTLGWGPKDGVEIRPIEEIVEQFDLVDVNKAPAMFDIKKLDHFNGEYIRMLDVDTFITNSSRFVEPVDPAVYKHLAPGVQERVSHFDQAPEFIDWIVGDAPEPSEKDWRKVMGKDKVGEVLDLVIQKLETAPWEAEALKTAVLGAGEELGVKSQLPVRLALTGKRSGLPLFEPMTLLTREAVLERLKVARNKI